MTSLSTQVSNPFWEVEWPLDKYPSRQAMKCSSFLLYMYPRPTLSCVTCDKCHTNNKLYKTEMKLNEIAQIPYVLNMSLNTRLFLSFILPHSIYNTFKCLLNDVIAGQNDPIYKLLPSSVIWTPRSTAHGKQRTKFWKPTITII